MNALILASMALAATETFAVEAFWYTDPATAPYVYYESTLTVPDLPAPDWQTTFIWPGLQPLPSSPHFLPINEGVLQTVLTYGTSCSFQSSDAGLVDTNKWWISAQYVNTYGPAFICTGGNAMNVNPGDKLTMVISLPTGSTVWQQTVTNLSNGKSVSFTYDLKGQEQAWAIFILELANGWHQYPPQFQVENIVLKTAPGTVNPCTFSSSAYSGYPGASINCNQPVRNGNVCTIDKCWFDTTSTGSTPGSVVGSACSSTAYGQCGGAGFAGSTCCPTGYTCQAYSQYWSSCQPSQAVIPPVTSLAQTTPVQTSATPTTTPSPSNCATAYAQCGSNGFPSCCVSGYTCTSMGTWSGCQPTTQNNQPPPVQTTQSQTSQSGTVAPWGQCGGIGYTGSTVCQTGYKCVYSSSWWSSCQPI
ncbi:hypothetical protein HK103_005490 [Boothiomyces macroporosus]|uniref:CBM1 domain-containing protein n=1 Tax=Boothiomyces macroporosus TaxID=261099 RepID=A0AAD5Y7T8_9FUNG|nr:hypothetical protein HK103_005490 [Boothiomyces macroporosus]